MKVASRMKLTNQQYLFSFSSAIRYSMTSSVTERSSKNFTFEYATCIQEQSWIFQTKLHRQYLEHPFDANTHTGQLTLVHCCLQIWIVVPTMYMTFINFLDSQQVIHRAMQLLLEVSVFVNNNKNIPVFSHVQYTCIMLFLHKIYSLLCNSTAVHWITEKASNTECWYLAQVMSLYYNF